MKTGILLISLVLYIWLLFYYFPNRGFIKLWINKPFPRYFSIENTEVVSVTRTMKSKKNSFEPETLPLPNTEFVYSPSPFTIDSSEKLRDFGLACMPDSFGYTISRGEEVFPEYEYPKCTKVNGQNDTYLFINRETNLVYLDCPDANNKILVGPFDSRKLITKEEGYPKWKVSNYKAPINADKIEFALGSCEKDEEKLMQVNTVPIFQEKAYENAKKLTKHKPKIIYFLTLDSMSRRHFFRKMPKTLEFLDSLNSNSSFSVFDFNLHNILGGDSADNQVPMLGGNIHFPKTQSGSQEKDFLGENAIWNLLRKKGYISVLALESCDHNFINALGRKPEIDYVLSPFNCAVDRFTSTKFGTGYHMQRCVSGHQTHYYVLNYTLEVLEMNPKVNTFIYIHIDSAHESTGQHAATMNTDIAEYLKTFLEKYQKDYEIFIFLQGDHGMRYGNFYKELSAYQEQKLPGLFIIASKSLLEKYPFSYNSLSMNTQRLVSKMDCRQTALYLEDIIESPPFSINLLTTIAPLSRVCDDLEINPWECSCLETFEVNEPSPQILNLSKILKNYAERTINSLSYTDPKHPFGKVCKKVVLGRVLKIYQTGVNNIHEIYKLEIESPTQTDMKFQVTFFLSSDGYQMRADKDKFVVENFGFGKYPVKIRVIFI